MRWAVADPPMRRERPNSFRRGMPAAPPRSVGPAPSPTGEAAERFRSRGEDFAAKRVPSAGLGDARRRKDADFRLATGRILAQPPCGRA